MSHEMAFSYRFINGNVIQWPGPTSRHWCKLRCSVHVSGSSFVDGERPTARHIEVVDQCAVQDIDPELRLFRNWEMVSLEKLRNPRVNRCISKPKSGFLGGRHWHTTYLFIVWPEYHIHCQSIHTSNYTANNRLCHKTAQGEIPIDLPDFVWVQLREQPGRP